MSVPVTIAIDNDHLLAAQQNAILVDKVEDYAPACLAIRNALQTRQRIFIGVRQRAVATWLTAYAQAYGEELVTVRKYTPRDALAEHWQITVPTSVSDQDIIQAKLLEVVVSARSGQSFDDLILEQFYSDILAYKTLPVGQLSALLTDYDAERWKAASARPLIARMLKNRLQQWYKLAQSDSIRTLVTSLRDDPAGLRRDLCVYKLLRGYPSELGQQVLAGRWDVFRKAKVDTDNLRLAYENGQAATEIEYYLTDIRDKISTADEVGMLLGQMSGALDVEYSFLDGLLRSHPEWIAPELLQRIERRFAPIRSRVSRPLAALRKLIQPAFPSEPQDDWGAEQWLQWVSGSYMPYYGWLEAQDKHDDMMTEYACRFADWYYTNFMLLKNGQSETFAFTALYRNRERINAKDAVTLALMVDNFNYVHFEELCRIFQAHGLSLADSEPLFSLMPTATEVGKAALIATTGDQIDLPANSYPGLVEKEWNNHSAGKQAAYLPYIGALQQVSKLDRDIYFLNFLPIDEALHQDAQETGRPHSEVIYEHLSTLAKSVADFTQRFQLEKRLSVYVLSDHGATRIAQGVVNVLDQSFYKSLSLKKHHRFIALADDKFKGLPQAAGQQCYLIDRHQYKTNHNYLAARRYYRFLATTDQFYVHGGLSPEEVVVPFARFTLVPAVPEAPTLTLLNSQFRFAVKSRVALEIGNPNGFPLEAIAVRLLDADAEKVILEKLEAKVKTPLELITTFRKTIGGANARPLTVSMKYSYQGTEYTTPGKEFTITMKAMMEETNDLDDLF